jgi:hypothetical protein
MARDFSNYDGFINDGTKDYGLIWYDSPGLSSSAFSAYASKPSTISKQLLPVRSDVGNSPWESRPDSGDVFSQGDWRDGAGQRYFHRPERNEKMAYDLYGYDISAEGKLSHLHLPTADSGITGSPPGGITLFNSLIFVGDASGNVKRTNGSAWPATWTAEATDAGEGASSVLDMTSSAQHLYVADFSNGVHRRDTAGTWTHYSGGTATHVAWLKNRLIATDDVGKIYEVITSGAYPVPIETLPTNWTWQSIFEIGGYIYAIATSVNDGLSEIHHFGLNATGSAIELRGVTRWPQGQIMYAGFGVIGLGFVGGGAQNSSGGWDPVLYEVAPDSQGFLSYFLIAQADPSTSTNDRSIKKIAPYRADSILFGWCSTTSGTGTVHAGLGYYNFGRGAFAPHLHTGVQKGTNGILVFQNRILFTQYPSGGFYFEDLTKYGAVGQFDSSIADWNNAGQKVWDYFELVLAEDLPAGTVAALDYNLSPFAGSYPPAITINTTGVRSASARISSLKSRQLGVRIVTNADGAGAVAPTISNFSVRSNPAPVTPEYILTRYVRILPKDRKDERAETVYPGAVDGAAGGDPETFRKALRNLVYTWVTFYEPGDTWTARIIEVADVEPDAPVYDADGGEVTDRAFIMRIVMEAS